jgi:putative acetyltransferase
VASTEIQLKPFKPENQAEVKALILAGMEDHWGVIDPTLNPDLNDIASTYARATFLVAWNHDRIVGTGALAPREDGQAEIVRMSVARDLRRCGIGRQILQRLIRTAKENGCRQVILETTETWQEVIAFYLQNGFRITHHLDGDVYFCLDLFATGEKEQLWPD